MPSITQSMSGPGTQPRRRLLTLGFGALAVAQLLAFGALCSQQVSKAQARETHDVVQRMARADCLQDVAGSTIASCRSQVTHAYAQQAQDIGTSGVMPASFNYR